MKSVKKVLAIMMAVGGLMLSPLIVQEASASSQTYTVNPGDSLWKISNEFNVQLDELRSLNHVWEHIEPEQELTIPNSPNKHTIEKGETLWRIAQNYDTTVTELKKANNLDSDLIYAEDTMCIPTKLEKSVSTTKTVTRKSSSDQRISVSDYERQLMAHAVYSEARSEPYEGQVAVASVIINRVRDDRWPNNVEGVIFEPWAFSPVHDGTFWLQPNQTAYDAVDDALNGWDPSQEAVFFYNPVTSTSNWIFSRTTITQIGQHVFAY
ncbi:cell wall hydrolase [Natranaerobius trueperi]|uniref:LysM domain-containing protein n=1 Tax=Natranaerobius trueperi TaxID=759412 RepID=A0A226C286_9FIRM|nr:cell wall hydrolase [Natranaerobius trueperi]OWZ84714.1 hypothetical protein CDO51_01420 [Natranaerobius trueperi]